MFWKEWRTEERSKVEEKKTPRPEQWTKQSYQNVSNGFDTYFCLLVLLCSHFMPFTCTCNQIKHAALSVRWITNPMANEEKKKLHQPNERQWIEKRIEEEKQKRKWSKTTMFNIPSRLASRSLCCCCFYLWSVCLLDGYWKWVENESVAYRSTLCENEAAGVESLANSTTKQTWDVDGN